MQGISSKGTQDTQKLRAKARALQPYVKSFRSKFNTKLKISAREKQRHGRLAQHIKPYQKIALHLETGKTISLTYLTR